VLGAVGALTGATRAAAQSDAEHFSGGRFTVLAYAADAGFARNLLAAAQANDTFPGLPRPRHAVVIALAPDDARFREWTGAQFPEWGVAAAFPARQTIVMHGHRGGGGEGDPLTVLRHELAHLALAEAMGDLPPRWFDEGYASYAAAEWGRDEVLATNLALVLRGPATFAALDSEFTGGSTRATAAYALAYRAIAELAGMDRERGLALFFARWRASESLDIAVREAYGMTLDAFETRWVSRTRRRYGGLALVADLALVAGLLGVFVIPMYVSRKRRDRRRLETLRMREVQQEQRARESALDALLAEPGEIRDRPLLDTPRDDL
jgi:hypothetical protein